MLDRIRIQEIERAIFKMREERPYGGRRIAKGEPFLVIDNAAISDFTVNKRSIIATGRSTEATTSIIKGVTFSLTNGQVMMDLFNAVFGNVECSQSTTFTVTGQATVTENNEIELPSIPDGELFLYTRNEFGGLKKIPQEKYTYKDPNGETKVKFSGEFGGYYIEFVDVDYTTQDIVYMYEERVDNVKRSTIGQIGEDIIGTLEMQCIAYDIYTERQMRILIKFDKVSLTTSLKISFNNSGKATDSIISVHALVPEMQNKVNKDIMTIELLDYVEDQGELEGQMSLDDLLALDYEETEEPSEPESF